MLAGPVAAAAEGGTLLMMQYADRGRAVFAGLGRVVLAVVVAIAGVGWFVPGAAAQTCDPTNLFAPDVRYSAGNRPRSVAIGDLDRDGDADLVVARFPGSLFVYMNNGDGTFAYPAIYQGPDNAYCVAIGDLDGDGDLDLAVANGRWVGRVSVLMNAGDGTFGFAVHYRLPSDTFTTSVAIGDLDGDGDLDMAMNEGGIDGSSNVRVLLNNGDGTFGDGSHPPGLPYSTGSGPGAVAISDLDGDSDADLVVATSSNTVCVLLNNGDATFAPDVHYGVGDNPVSVATGDLDGDGDVDLAVANNLSDNVSVLLNNGDGTFAPDVVYGFVGDFTSFVAIGDLDRDGDADLALANGVLSGSGDNISILLNTGSGAFRPAIPYGVDQDPSSVAIGDLDGDGHADLAVSNYRGNNVSVLLNRCTEAMEVALVDPRTATFRRGDWLADPASDPAVFVNGGHEIDGFAADGVTPILVGIELSGPGVLRLTLPSDGSAGVFRGFDRSPLGTSTQPAIHEVDGQHYAFAVIAAPEDFVADPSHERLGEREAILDIRWRADSAPFTTELSRSLTVTRPPVMLLHGLWGSFDSTWGDDFKAELEAVGLTLTPADYRETHADPFVENVELVLGEISRVLEAHRETGIAVTQADVVGHSMGGVLTRMFIADEASQPYRDERNYGEGDVNRLISLVTPHCGARTAEWLTGSDGEPTIVGLVFNRMGLDVTQGAVRDLRQDRIALPPTLGLGVPLHALTGSGGDEAVGVAASSVCLLAGGVTCRAWKTFWNLASIFDVQTQVFGDSDHDLVVGINSQRSGLGSPFVTDFGISLPFDFGVHVTVNRETRVAERIVDLLNTPIGDAVWAAGFPASCPDGPLPPPLPPLYTGPGGLDIISPAPGFEIMAGDTIEVEVAVSGDFVLIDGVVHSTADAMPFDGGTIVLLHVPTSATGTMTIGALGFGDTGEVALAETVQGRIIIPADLVGVEIAQRSVILTEYATTQRVRLMGQYSDGIERELAIDDDVSWMIDDTTISAVSPDGVVTGLQTGTTQLTVMVDTGSGVLEDSVAVRVLGIEPCRPDLDGDGELTIFDFLAFQNAFDVGDPIADFDGDGSFTIFDFLAFQNEFDAGC